MYAVGGQGWNGPSWIFDFDIFLSELNLRGFFIVRNLDLGLRMLRQLCINNNIDE